MDIYYGTMTSKGQTTIPSEVRELLNLKPGDKIRYIHKDGQIAIKAKNKRAIDLAGKFHDPERPVISLNEIDEAIGLAIEDRVGKIR